MVLPESQILELRYKGVLISEVKVGDQCRGSEGLLWVLRSYAVLKRR